MPNEQATADVNIHLRARPQDRILIDQAAELVGANRSQFMLSSAIKEAKAVLLDQTSVYMNAPAFQKTLDWMDAPVSAEEAAGMKRLMAAKTNWSRG
ncbi:DUF1778 domain-containing protein [Pleomorphomonas carboxyditropha]|uniref:DUF1778 domain-containing protein n=1 Tax=Pleomorphomonas carboxyditropha TaxID=2023338 RepID=A0A2G9X173_9HYPH|nr:DUF1778 domain-containing protein [Pleomorphomonas carboxyditropha]PIP00717.1 hypothetical protein CJ014_01020 [Pleomorphomonas carboxyditropha]